VQTRITNDLWLGLRDDPAWNAICRGGPEECPPKASLTATLRRHGIRFPIQKAERLRKARSRDFGAIAREIRQTFEKVHDRRSNPGRRRQAELALSTLLQEELRGCGVAPKVSRLALTMGASEITQLIPIDSRWQSALEEAGHGIRPADLADEARYRPIEDVLVEVSHELGIRPTDADGIGFGWLVSADEPVTS
jgi:hypothetical protein